MPTDPPRDAPNLEYLRLLERFPKSFLCARKYDWPVPRCVGFGQTMEHRIRQEKLRFKSKAEEQKFALGVLMEEIKSDGLHLRKRNWLLETVSSLIRGNEERCAKAHAIRAWGRQGMSGYGVKHEYKRLFKKFPHMFMLAMSMHWDVQKCVAFSLEHERECVERGIEDEARHALAAVTAEIKVEAERERRKTFLLKHVFRVLTGDQERAHVREATLFWAHESIEDLDERMEYNRLYNRFPQAFACARKYGWLNEKTLEVAHTAEAALEGEAAQEEGEAAQEEGQVAFQMVAARIKLDAFAEKKGYYLSRVAALLTQDDARLAMCDAVRTWAGEGVDWLEQKLECGRLVQRFPKAMKVIKQRQWSLDRTISFGASVEAGIIDRRILSKAECSKFALKLAMEAVRKDDILLKKRHWMLNIATSLILGDKERTAVVSALETWSTRAFNGQLTDIRSATEEEIDAFTKGESMEATESEGPDDAEGQEFIRLFDKFKKAFMLAERVEWDLPKCVAFGLSQELECAERGIGGEATQAKAALKSVALCIRREASEHPEKISRLLKAVVTHLEVGVAKEAAAQVGAAKEAVAAAKASGDPAVVAKAQQAVADAEAHHQKAAKKVVTRSEFDRFSSKYSDAMRYLEKADWPLRRCVKFGIDAEAEICEKCIVEADRAQYVMDMVTDKLNVEIILKQEKEWMVKWMLNCLTLKNAIHDWGASWVHVEAKVKVEHQRLANDCPQIFSVIPNQWSAQKRVNVVSEIENQLSDKISRKSIATDRWSQHHSLLLLARSMLPE